jgi:hypothetical protein
MQMFVLGEMNLQCVTGYLDVFFVAMNFAEQREARCNVAEFIQRRSGRGGGRNVGALVNVNANFFRRRDLRHFRIPSCPPWVRATPACLVKTRKYANSEQDRPNSPVVKKKKYRYTEL